MADFDLKLQIKAEDKASQQIEAVAKKVKRANDEIKSSTKQSEFAQQEAKQRTAQVAQQHATKAEMLAKRVASAQRTLGVRAERDLQAELRRTRQAYDILAKSGVASARDLARAKEQVIKKERELRAEMGKTPMGQRLAGIGQNAMGLVAGATAGAMVMTNPVRKSMGYDRDLAMVANTAFSDRDAAGRIEGKKELNKAVQNAVTTGGGTKEDALASLNALLASGMKANTAMNLLPTLQKASTATGASAEELAAITVSALQNGIAEADIGKALDMAVAAGQAGQFELRDMAKWLPQQMAKANAMGLTGLEGFQTLLVANQQARVTAGTNDEAGNNLSNLLGKITAKETAERFSKIEYKDKNGKLREINYLKSMEAYKSQGKNSLEAFMSIMDQVVSGNDGYKALQEKLKTAKKEDQQKILTEMAKLFEGSAIAEIVSDQQALMALLGIRNNVQLGKEVNSQVQNSQGAINTSYAVIADTNAHKVEAVKSAAEFAQMESLKGFNDLLGDASVKLTEYANKYPELTTAVAGAATGVAAIGAAALAAAGSITLLGKNKSVGGGISDILDTATSGKGAGKYLKWGSRIAGVAGVATMLHGDQAPMSEERKAQLADSTYQAEQLYKHKKEVLGSRFHSFFRSDETLSQYRKDVAAYEANQQARPVSGGLFGVAKQISQLNSQQNGLKGQVDSATEVLNNYQADFKAFGDTISAGLQAGLASQTHTLDNRITVELDGNVIAEQVSQKQFNFMNRGVA
ncbi:MULTISPECIES: phage tail tape measure protein [Glaesserella]|uniref:Phage tail tape measure protein n=1 Tax=Glaesserella australis TaxID=2094024 RepID=A0A328BW72_9PAST|nr:MULTISPECIES: phage tail tape measure protein [Glaesserella]AUI65214.1 phage tail tape measure protein [Glaesserella sp. 15-184]RAL18486.1 phage tail tape measure protein [Glaesserella australis]